MARLLAVWRGLSFNCGQPLYILPFDQRELFQTKRFGWEGEVNAAETAEDLAVLWVLILLSVVLFWRHRPTAGALLPP